MRKTEPSVYRLILVEDSDEDRETFRAKLKEINLDRAAYNERWSITEFGGLDEAIQHLDAPLPFGRPQVLVCDLDFSGCQDGIKLVEYATNLPTPVPCLVLSQSTDRDIRSECLKAGALAFVSKLRFEDMSAQDLHELLLDVLCLWSARQAANRFSNWKHVQNGSVVLGHDLLRALNENLEVVQQLADPAQSITDDERRSVAVSFMDGHKFAETIVRDFTEAAHLIEQVPTTDEFCAKALLEKVLSNREDFWRKRYNKTSLVVTISGPEACPCLCNETRVRRALANVIDNAVKFSIKASEIAIRILDYSGVDDARYWALQITDNGDGVPEDQLHLISSPLVRLASTAALPGWGFGLHSCVDLMRPYSTDLGGQPNPGFRNAASGGLEVTLFVPQHPSQLRQQ